MITEPHPEERRRTQRRRASPKDELKDRRLLSIRDALAARSSRTRI